MAITRSANPVSAIDVLRPLFHPRAALAQDQEPGLRWIADGFLSSSPMTPATQWVSMYPFCLGLATTSARAALRLKAGRQPLCQRPSHAPHFWRAVFHSNVSRLRQSCLGRRLMHPRCAEGEAASPAETRRTLVITIIQTPRSPRAYVIAGRLLGVNNREN
jgi:hypothetical protein